MARHKFARIAVLLLCSVCLAAPSAGLLSKVKELAWKKDVRTAEQLIERHRPSNGEITAEWLAAVSWAARGASFAEDWDTAERYAREAIEGSQALLQQRELDADSHLPTALGASIEVLAHVYDAHGDRASAVAFLREQRDKYRGSSIEARLQKNIHLLSLEGKPLPEIVSDAYLGNKPPEPAQWKGKVALFYFWAHWCSDCKRQKPILEALHEKYGSRGLVIVGPTRLYGYVARGKDATAEEELAYLKGAYQESHPIPSWMPCPVSTENFLNFGVSTTPTLVLVDRQGIVRLYHPGNLSYEEIAGRIERLLS